LLAYVEKNRVNYYDAIFFFFGRPGGPLSIALAGPSSQGLEVLLRCGFFWLKKPKKNSSDSYRGFVSLAQHYDFRCNH
jgi:hypothetical protein